MNHRVLNLGAGTQSSWVYLMMCWGDLEAAEVAIFADTQWEPPVVYEHLKWLEKEGAGRVPIVRVTAGDLRKDAIEVGEERKRYASIPLHVLNPDGSRGILRRQCTREYKIDPITRWVREHVFKIKKRRRVPKETHLFKVFGLSFDERNRKSIPVEKWATHVYPLIDMGLRRGQVILRAQRRYPGHTFPRSACVGCPYHSETEWKQIMSDPELRADVVDFDRSIRKAQEGRKQLKGKVFVHRSGQPIENVEFVEDEKEDGLLNNLGLANECEGMCGL